MMFENNEVQPLLNDGLEEQENEYPQEISSPSEEEESLKIQELLKEIGKLALADPTKFGNMTGLEKFMIHLRLADQISRDDFESVVHNKDQRTTIYIWKLFCEILPNHTSRFREIAETMARCYFVDAVKLIKDHTDYEWCENLDNLLKDALKLGKEDMAIYFRRRVETQNALYGFMAFLITCLIVGAIVGSVILEINKPTPSPGPVTTMSPPEQVLPFKANDFASLPSLETLVLNPKSGNVTLINSEGEVVAENIISPWDKVRGIDSRSIAFNPQQNVTIILGCHSLKPYMPKRKYCEAPNATAPFCYCGCIPRGCLMEKCYVLYYKMGNTSMEWEYQGNQPWWTSPDRTYLPTPYFDSCKQASTRLEKLVAGKTTGNIYFNLGITATKNTTWRNSTLLPEYRIYRYQIPTVKKNYINDFCIKGSPRHSGNKCAQIENIQGNMRNRDLASAENTIFSQPQPGGDLVALLMSNDFRLDLIQIINNTRGASVPYYARPRAKYYNSVTFLNQSFLVVSTAIPNWAFVKDIRSDEFYCWVLKFDRPAERIRFSNGLLYVGFGNKANARAYRGPFACIPSDQL